jgi:2-polyprenyl-3-methyl-5-hydroxy-6-metoxy-1,4-benzoquinol methylase
MNSKNAIGSRPNPTCVVCGAPGEVLYAGLRDRLFSAPGEWNIKRCSNTSCGLLWLDPMPLETEVWKAYENYYTHSENAKNRPAWFSAILIGAKRGYLARRYGYYPSLPFSDRMLGLLPNIYPGRSSELDLSVMWLPASRRGRLLDIGSGSGWLVENMNAGGWQAEGLDFDSRAVEQARRRGLKVHLGDLASQRFANGSFDAVTMCHSIEHVHAPTLWLEECVRILRPGGCLAVATPNNASLGHRVFGSDWLALDPPRHLHLFNMATLRRLLEKAGFSRIRVFTSPRDANGVYLASRSIGRIGRFDMIAPQSMSARLAGRIAQLGELVAHRFRPALGEDLIAIAEK